MLVKSLWNIRDKKDNKEYIVEEPGFKNVKNKHLGMSPF